MAFTLRSERGLGQAILVAQDANLDGDKTLRHGLPAGFGDCLITEVLVRVTSIATAVASTITGDGPVVTVEISSGIVDFIGASKWVVNAGVTAASDSISAQVECDEPVFWHEGEELRVDFPEVDGNASPTADSDIFVRVQRLRQPQQLSTEFQLTS